MLHQRGAEAKLGIWLSGEVAGGVYGAVVSRWQAIAATATMFSESTPAARALNPDAAPRRNPPVTGPRRQLSPFIPNGPRFLPTSHPPAPQRHNRVPRPQRSLAKELERREAAARAEAEELRGRIAQLAECLAGVEERLSQLVIAREAVDQVLGTVPVEVPPVPLAAEQLAATESPNMVARLPSGHCRHCGHCGHCGRMTRPSTVCGVRHWSGSS
jgi:hypothetical protein